MSAIQQMAALVPIGVSIWLKAFACNFMRVREQKSCEMWCKMQLEAS